MAFFQKITLFSLLSLFCLVGSAVAQNYSVQIGAYQTPVSSSYFSERGLDGVYSERGLNFTTYFYGKYNNITDAENARSNASVKGFETAIVIDMVERSRNCANSCKVDLDKIRNVFFDFDKSYLRPQGKADLDKLVQILNQNSTYMVEVHAHTDAKGSNSYNDALAKRRENAVKSYLRSNGISSSRISGFTYGEETPIAKNEVNGSDTPEGRQLNRRVELRVKDQNTLLNIVEAIYVPSTLQK
ncbi:MAG: OmpA family protein [Chitinophagales bacterium]